MRDESEVVAMTCQARQYSDQMRCKACSLVWDTNDSEPPPCGNKTQSPLKVKDKMPITACRHTEHHYPEKRRPRKWSAKQFKEAKRDGGITTEMWDKLKDTCSGKTNGKRT